MKFYNGGVYDDPDCKRDAYDLDHCALIVGYGSVDAKDYWIVKNSWGIHWGEKGYIKMSRNKNGQCGIDSFSFYPVLT